MNYLCDIPILFLKNKQKQKFVKIRGLLSTFSMSFPFSRHNVRVEANEPQRPDHHTEPRPDRVVMEPPRLESNPERKPDPRPETIQDLVTNKPEIRTRLVEFRLENKICPFLKKSLCSL